MSKKNNDKLGNSLALFAHLFLMAGLLVIAIPLVTVVIAVAGAAFNAFVDGGNWFMAVLMGGVLMMLLGMIFVGLVDLFKK